MYLMKKIIMEDVFTKLFLPSKKLLNIHYILGTAVTSGLQAGHRGCNIILGKFHMGGSVKDECFGSREPQKVSPNIKLQKRGLKK